MMAIENVLEAKILLQICDLKYELNISPGLLGGYA